MITSTDIAFQVTESLGADVDDFDVAGIVAAVIDQHGRVDIDSIDAADYWGIVEAHAK